MKILKIGRGNDCNIVIPDDSDQVSRHHVDLSFTLWGKMRMTDKSTNGTYINGTRMERDKVYLVRRSDTISFAKVWNFDWDVVKDPYKVTRKIVIGCIVLFSLLMIGGVTFGTYYLTKPSKSSNEIVIGKNNIVDSTRQEVPVDTANVLQNSGKSEQVVAEKKKNGKKHKELDKDLKDDSVIIIEKGKKETETVSPIIY